MQSFLHQPNKPNNPTQYLQETLLLSNQQNPKKESKEDEEKWRMSGLFIVIKEELGF